MIHDQIDGWRQAASRFPEGRMAKHPTRRSDITARLVEGEMVVLDRERDLVHQLNLTATFIWQRCDGQCTGEEIARQLVEAFDIDSRTAEASVGLALQQFERLGLLERA
jgi:Coenzyme PQQ synthesis protein D (PqqD)